MTTSYREDLDDRHHLLSGDLTHILTDIRCAIAALTWLTELDGPQPIEISTGITAAEQAIRTAQRALEQAAEPTLDHRNRHFVGGGPDRPEQSHLEEPWL